MIMGDFPRYQESNENQSSFSGALAAFCEPASSVGGASAGLSSALGVVSSLLKVLLPDPKSASVPKLLLWDLLLVPPLV